MVLRFIGSILAGIIDETLHRLRCKTMVLLQQRLLPGFRPHKVRLESLASEPETLLPESVQIRVGKEKRIGSNNPSIENHLRISNRA